METIEAIGVPLGVTLTALILSYLLIGDNPVYRLALHIFIGALTGYTFGIVLQEIVLTLIDLLGEVLLLAPLAMGLWLLMFKPVPRLAYVGNFALAYLVGVGAAVALGGALLGTLIPQIRATSQALSFGFMNLSNPSDLRLLADGVLVVVGTVCTLMVFNFGVPEQRGLAGMWGQLTKLLASIGRIFLTVALGAAFAGALTASLSILIGRIQPIIDTIVDLYIVMIGG